MISAIFVALWLIVTFRERKNFTQFILKHKIGMYLQNFNTNLYLKISVLGLSVKCSEMSYIPALVFLFLVSLTLQATDESGFIEDP